MPSISKRVLGALALAVALPLAATACGGGEGGGGDTIVIGTKFDQPGLGLKKPDGTMSGFDVDVAKYVAEQLGYKEDKIEWKEAPSGQRETLIQNDQVTFIAATYSITDARKEKVSFAGPYLVTGQSLLVKADNTDITGAGVAAEQQETVLCFGFDSGAAHQGQVPECAVAAVRHVLGMRRGTQERSRRCGHH